jgi:hypothetical protein
VQAKVCSAIEPLKFTIGAVFFGLLEPFLYFSRAERERDGLTRHSPQANMLQCSVQDAENVSSGAPPGAHLVHGTHADKVALISRTDSTTLDGDTFLVASLHRRGSAEGSVRTKSFASTRLHAKKKLFAKASLQ